MSNRTPLIIENISYHYKSHWTGKKTLALKNIHLELQPGEMFGFLGRSGAGKTTTIKSILNLIKISSGNILIFGEPHTSTESRSSIGYLPERPYFYDHLTVEELLFMFARLSKSEHAPTQILIEELLEKVDLKGLQKAPLQTLSKGQTQKVAMAQALLGNPKLLILDEPFSGLDPFGRKLFRELLYDLKQKGVTIFLSSHILEDIQNICDRVSIMADGEVKKIFSLSDLHSISNSSYELVLRKKSTESYSGEETQTPGQELSRYIYKNVEEAHKDLQKAMGSADEIEKFQAISPSLENLFMETISEKESVL